MYQFCDFYKSHAKCDQLQEKYKEKTENNKRNNKKKIKNVCEILLWICLFVPEKIAWLLDKGCECGTKSTVALKY